jgi:hypothetical protein
MWAANARGDEDAREALTLSLLLLRCAAKFAADANTTTAKCTRLRRAETTAASCSAPCGDVEPVASFACTM